MYGTTTQVPVAGVAAVTQPMGVYGQGAANGYKSMLDPHNPLMWLGVFLLATVGAAGVSGSARLGPARASAGVGKE
jgi:hypothetical protein